MILPHGKPILSMSCAHVPASKHLQLYRGKAAVIFVPVIRVKKSSMFNAVWRTLCHYSEAMCSMVISISH